MKYRVFVEAKPGRKEQITQFEHRVQAEHTYSMLLSSQDERDRKVCLESLYNNRWCVISSQFVRGEKPEQSPAQGWGSWTASVSWYRKVYDE